MKTNIQTNHLQLIAFFGIGLCFAMALLWLMVAIARHIHWVLGLLDTLPE